MEVLGIDIGGSGIKAGIVDTITGQLVSEKLRIPTPKPSVPDAVVATIKQAIETLKYSGPIGIGFPAAVTLGTIRTATNVDQSWKGLQADEYFSLSLGMPCTILNDADAAGYAEITFGAGAGIAGLVVMITVGTGIGTAIFVDGILVPNMEFGHIHFKGDIAERYVSDNVRKSKGLSWTKWGKRFNKYLLHLEDLVWPQLFIIGGGASRKFEEYEEVFTTRTKVVPAAHRNKAGVIGAAMAAAKTMNKAV